MTLKTKQLLLAGGLGALGLLIMWLLIWTMEESLPPPEPAPAKTIASLGEQLDPRELWVDRLESEHTLTRTKLEALEKALLNQVQQGQTETAQLRQEMQKLQEQEPPLSSPPSSTSYPLQPQPERPPDVPLGLQKQVLNLKSRTRGKTVLKTLENTLPAGTFIRGILLSGVDASTAVSAAGHPQPVLLRLTDHGTLPRAFQSDMKDCHVLASAYGDLSSERVYMRLEKLTCVERLTGEIIETEVTGYVAGEDGRAGIRGIVVDRSGPVIRNSLLGGFFSGVGKFFETANAPVMAFPTPNGMAPQQILRTGAMGGASTAMDKFADFYIKRAEQLQPILQVAAGREVDIVITQGTKLGGTEARQALEVIRNRSRKEALEKMSSTSPSSFPSLPSSSGAPS